MHYLPDRFGVVQSAAEGVADFAFLPALAAATDTPEDTLEATRAMVRAGARVLVTHGGDGTNRLVALAAGSVPILPIAAGTNNVFPVCVEPTAAGFAAGFLGRLSWSQAVAAGCVSQHKRIRVTVGDRSDVALVDAALVRDTTIGARAVWDPRKIAAFMVTRASAASLGLTSMAGTLCSIGPTEPRGAFVELGPGITVEAFLAPGLVAEVGVRSLREIPVGSSETFEPTTGTIALDGERTLVVEHEPVRFSLEQAGPWVVDVSATLLEAQRMSAFTKRPR